MRQKRLFTLMIAGTALMGTACTPTLRSHGYIPAENQPQAVEPEVDTKATVLARLGNPSTTGVFENDTWYYISSTRERLAYLNPAQPDRSITAIKFAEDGAVLAVNEYSIENGRIIDLVDRKTPTRGRELSLLEQIFGNVGRLPTESITGNRDLPGGGGGPQR